MIKNATHRTKLVGSLQACPVSKTSDCQVTTLTK